MVDLSNIAKNLGTDPLASAGASQAAGAAKGIERRKIKKKVSTDRGLGLEDIPEGSPYIPVQDANVDEETTPASGADGAAATQATGEVTAEADLAKIDYELAELQAMIKQVISRKIQLADRHEDRRHDLLVSAFNDCKNAYLKIKEVRNAIG